MSEGESTVKGAMGLMAGLVMASPLQSTIQQLCQPRPVDNTDALMAHAKNARTVEANRIITRQNDRIEKLQNALRQTQERAVESLTTQEQYIRDLETKNRMLAQMNEQLAARVSTPKEIGTASQIEIDLTAEPAENVPRR